MGPMKRRGGRWASRSSCAAAKPRPGSPHRPPPPPPFWAQFPRHSEGNRPTRRLPPGWGLGSRLRMAESIAELDRRFLWHPFTQQPGWAEEEPVAIERAEGTDLIDVDGRRYIDGVSSLWCNVHGHRHPLIDHALRKQLDRMAHSTMLGLTHRGAAELAAQLVELAPPGLSRGFYSDSGSSAAEIALKMAVQYWRQRGGP